MTVQMPQDTVDLLVYVKTPRGNSAVNMDPWTSSTWRKPWNKYHTPNKVTKDKLTRFTQQKTHRGISLNKTAGRQSWNKNWSPRSLLFYKETHMYKDPVRRSCLFLSNHQLTCPRQWTCQEQSTDMVANFGSMYKTSSSDAQAQATSQVTTHINIKYSKVTTSPLKVTTSAVMNSLERNTCTLKYGKNITSVQCHQVTT